MTVTTSVSTGQATRELEMYFGPQHVGMVGNFGIILTVEGDTVVRARANPGTSIGDSRNSWSAEPIYRTSRSSAGST